MKFLCLPIVLFLFINPVFAQVFPDENISYYRVDRKSDQAYKDNHVKERKSISTKNGKPVKNSERMMRFNASGKQILESRPGKKLEFHFQYFADTLYAGYTRIKDGDTLNMVTNSYNEKSLLVRTDYQRKSRNQPGSYCVFTYNGMGKKTSSECFNKKGKSESRNEFDYWENGSRKESRYYRKGKLKYVYTYECDPKGEAQKPKTEQINYCTKKTMNNDGSFIEIVETKEKNKVRKIVYTYAADSSLVKYESYNMKGKLNYFSQYTYYEGGKKLKSYTYFTGKGSFKLGFDYEYNEKGLYTKAIQYKGKPTKVNQIDTFEYTYY